MRLQAKARYAVFQRVRPALPIFLLSSMSTQHHIFRQLTPDTGFPAGLYSADRSQSNFFSFFKQKLYANVESCQVLFTSIKVDTLKKGD